MPAEVAAVKAAEPEVVAPERTPDETPGRTDLAPWLAQRPLAFGAADPPELPRVLGTADTGTRVRVMEELQRRHGNAHVQRLLAARAPDAAARAVGGLETGLSAPPANAAGGSQRGGAIPEFVGIRIAADVDRMAAAARGRALPLGPDEVDDVVAAVRWYGDTGRRAVEKRRADAPNVYVDKFITASLAKGYDRGVLITDYSNAWDDILENASDDQAAELRRLLTGVGSAYTTYRPSADPNAASFWKDVGDPVFFKATQLLSFGIVDKELFSESNRLIYADDYGGLVSFIGTRVGRGVLDTFTLGAGSAYLRGIWEFAETNPNASFDEVLAAGGSSALDAVLPKQEIETIYSAATGTSMAPGELPPDKWQAMEAFWVGTMKIIALVAAAKGAREYGAKHGVLSKPPLTGDLTAEGLHTGGTKPKPGEEPTGRPGDKPEAVVRAAMAFGDAVRLIELRLKGQSWTKIVTDPTAPEAIALEAARSRFAQELGGVRTGRIGPVHDLDITVRSNAEAQAWMSRAVKELFGKDLKDVPEADGVELMKGVKEALDVNISTDAGRVTFYDASGLSRGGAVRAEQAGLRAAQIARMRILKGLADKGNPEAPRLLQIAARDTGIDPAKLKPIDRVPASEAPAQTKARIAELRRQIDIIAKLNETKPTDFDAGRLVRLQTELLTLDPEAYLYAGGVKAEVILQEPRSSFTKGPGQARLSGREGQGNIENNHLNAINELSKAPAGKDPYLYVGGKPSFSKYVWRILRTANKFRIRVDPALIERANRINLGKGPAVATELPTDAAKRAYVRSCLDEIARVEEAYKAQLARIERPADTPTVPAAYATAPGGPAEVPLAEDDRDLIGSVEAEVLQNAAGPGPGPASAAGPGAPRRGPTAGPITTPSASPGRSFSPPTDAASGSGGVVVDARTLDYEARVLPDLYVRRRSALADQILQAIRAEDSRPADATGDATSPATAWWECFLDANADDYVDSVAGTTVSPKERTVDRAGAIAEIDNFLDVDPPFPAFVSMYRAGLADFMTGRIRVPAGVGGRSAAGP